MASGPHDGRHRGGQYTKDRRIWNNSHRPSHQSRGVQEEKTSRWMMPWCVYVLLASIIIVFYIYVSFDHGQLTIHLSECKSCRTSKFSIERTTTPTRLVADTVEVVSTPNQVRHGESIHKMSTASKGIKENRTYPIDVEANRSICDVDTQLMPAGSMPLVALASAPGSGNTWLRLLIEKATGIYTGSIYTDKSLIRGGFLGESEDPRNGRVVVVKMHNINRMKSELKGIILLIRSPYSSIVSEFNREMSHSNHTGLSPVEAFNTSYWAQFVKCTLQRWQMIAKDCIKAPVRKLVVYYEDLQTDLRQQLRRIVSFLGLPVDEIRIKCAVLNSEGNFHRSKRVKFDPFTENLTTTVDRTIEDLYTFFLQNKRECKSLKEYERNITSLDRYNSTAFDNGRCRPISVVNSLRKDPSFRKMIKNEKN